jgi:tetratricopeptide (TPR) repeat protein
MIAIQKLQSNKSELYSHPICGSLHKEFAKLCLKAKCYQHSLKVIESPVISFLKFTQPMDVVSYLYYKGLIYTGLQRYEEAMEQFSLVLAYPSQCVHKVHSDSYKKLILLSLIQVTEGKIPKANA